MSCVLCCFGLSRSSKEIPRQASPLGKVERKAKNQRILKGDISLGAKDSTYLTSSLDKKKGTLIYMNKDDEVRENNRIPTPEHTQKRHWEEKDRVRCFFCRGLKCKHENYLLHPHPAVIGLHCDFITPDIIASQRPSTVLFKQFNLIQQFKAISLGLVVNLQREGEHPYCGPNGQLENETGFSYLPHDLISEDIRYRACGWKDMSVPDSINFILEIVKEMSFTVNELKKKVLVHCHAGYGRTGVLIACYMIFDTNLTVEKVIHEIRQKRHGSIQKDSQYSFCKRFKQYIDKIRLIFVPYKRPICQIMNNQNDLLFGEEKLKYEYIPKVLFIILERISEYKKNGKITIEEIYDIMYFPQEWTSQQEETLAEMKENINQNNWADLAQNDRDPVILFQLLYDWIEDCVEEVINPTKIEKIFKQYHLDHVRYQGIEDVKNFAREDIVGLCMGVKNELKTIEFETLFYVAYFVSDIFPDEIKINHAFDNAILRLASQLLGFPQEAVFSNKNREEAKGIMLFTSQLATLLKLLALLCKFDLSEDLSPKKSDSSIYLSRKKLGLFNPKSLTFYANRNSYYPLSKHDFNIGNISSDNEGKCFQAKRQCKAISINIPTRSQPFNETIDEYLLKKNIENPSVTSSPNKMILKDNINDGLIINGSCRNSLFPINEEISIPQQTLTKFNKLNNPKEKAVSHKMPKVIQDILDESDDVCMNDPSELKDNLDPEECKKRALNLLTQIKTKDKQMMGTTTLSKTKSLGSSKIRTKSVPQLVNGINYEQ